MKNQLIEYIKCNGGMDNGYTKVTSRLLYHNGLSMTITKAMITLWMITMGIQWPVVGFNSFVVHCTRGTTSHNACGMSVVS